MALLRRVLGPLTAIWLFCQVGTMALVPVASWTSAVDSHAAECTCGHGAAALCPMHHTSTAESVPCAMQAAKNAGAAFVSTLAGTAGPVSEPARSFRPEAPWTLHRPADVYLTGERPVPPDPPPPRA